MVNAQQESPDDFVIATGKQYSVRDFVNTACKNLDINIKWDGKGVNEVGIDESGKNYSSSPRLFQTC